MKYISADLETTGLSPKTPTSIMAASFVVEDSSSPEIPVENLPHLSVLIDPGKDGFKGPVGLTAMAMNAWILVGIELKIAERAAKGNLNLEHFIKSKLALGISPDVIDRAIKERTHYALMTLEEFEVASVAFIYAHFGRDNATLAGKNAASFDLQFFPEALKAKFKHRIIDPGTRFADFSEDSRGLPTSEKVLERANLGGVVTHGAIQDAWDVIKALRKTYHWKPTDLIQK